MLSLFFQAMQWEEQKFPNGEKDYSSIVQVEINFKWIKSMRNMLLIDRPVLFLAGLPGPNIMHL